MPSPFVSFCTIYTYRGWGTIRPRSMILFNFVDFPQNPSRHFPKLLGSIPPKITLTSNYPQIFVSKNMLRGFHQANHVYDRISIFNTFFQLLVLLRETIHTFYHHTMFLWLPHPSLSLFLSAINTIRQSRPQCC
jgi:hypothetical protein